MHLQYLHLLALRFASYLDVVALYGILQLCLTSVIYL